MHAHVMHLQIHIYWLVTVVIEYDNSKNFSLKSGRNDIIYEE